MNIFIDSRSRLKDFKYQCKISWSTKWCLYMECFSN